MGSARGEVPFLTIRACAPVLGDSELPCSVIGQTQIDQPAQVEGGDSMREPELIALDTAETNPSVPPDDEPRDGTLDHWAPPAVFLEAVSLSPLRSGGRQLIVMGMDAELEATG